MKNIIIVLMFLSLPGTAKGTFIDPETPLIVKLESADNKLGLNFLIQARDDRSVIVRIRNKERKVIFEQSFHGSNAYKGTFNLENLVDGRYYIEVRHSKQKYVKQINLKKYALRTVSLS